MQHIPPFEAVTLVHRGGRREVFRNLDSVVRAYGYGRLCRELGDSFKQHYSFHYAWHIDADGEEVPELIDRTSNADAFVLLGPNGDILTHASLPLPPYRQRHWWGMDFWNGEGAVPGTGRSRYSRRRPRMRLQSARRQSEVLEDDIGPRPARRAHNLPSYEPGWRSTTGNHNWKLHRPHQWKNET